MPGRLGSHGRMKMEVDRVVRIGGLDAASHVGPAVRAELTG
ncbi:MAG: hypothetical protein WBP81_05610 [Solirubrobacteraceae bacterium]